MSTLRNGWKSALYEDRYQLVAIITRRPPNLEIMHLHEYEGHIPSSSFTSRADDICMDGESDIEVTVIVHGQGIPKPYIMHDLHYEIQEFLWHATDSYQHQRG